MIKGNNENFTWIEVDNIIIAMQTNNEMECGNIKYDNFASIDFDSFINGKYDKNMFTDTLFFNKDDNKAIECLDSYTAITSIEINAKNDNDEVVVYFEDAWDSECVTYFSVKNATKFIEALDYIKEVRIEAVKKEQNKFEMMYSTNNK